MTFGGGREGEREETLLEGLKLGGGIVLFGVRWRSGWEGVAIAIVVLSTAHAGTEYLGKSGRDGSVTNRT
jgi:hypothetical protein